MTRLILPILALFLIFSVSGRGANEAVTYDIPRLAGITVDGDSSDWANSGFMIDTVVDRWFRLDSPEDFTVRARLGWDHRGLLFHLAVSDDELVLPDTIEDILYSDSLTIWAGSPRLPKDVWKLLVSPGLAEDTSQVAIWPGTHPANIEIAHRDSESGYAIEVRWPWEVAGVQPKTGETCLFGLRVHDRDLDGQDSYASWAVANPPGEFTPFQRLVLSNDPGMGIKIVARAGFRSLREADAEFLAPGEFAGKSFVVKDAGGVTVLASSFAGEETGWVRKSVRLPIRDLMPPSSPLTIHVDSRLLGRFSLPDYKQEMAWTLFNEDFRFRPSVFSGDSLPTGEFEHPFMVEELIGPYTVTYQYFDSAFEEVTKARSPGRYGAIATIIPESGPPFRRFSTLFKQSTAFRHWQQWNPDWHITLPEQFGIDPLVARESHEIVNSALKWIFLDSHNESADAAVLLSALHERVPREQRSLTAENPLAADRQWWVDLEGSIEGRSAPEIPEMPRKRSIPAPILREGDASDAGVRKTAVEEIERHLEKWAEDSDEGFSVCLARNGIIFLNKAYGQCRERPKRTTDPSYLASISKLLGGVTFMMLVDAGLIDLDDAVSKYFPELEFPQEGTELTIRHLFTHTSGMRQHSGVFEHDLIDRLRHVAPHLGVGLTHLYNGTDNELAGKIIERLTGEALPFFFERHLLQPLGCENSAFFSMSWMSYATAEELARVGQMLLNKGSYGNWEFMSEETYERFLPAPIEPLISHESDNWEGIGAVEYRGLGFGAGTIGHESASATIFRVDPEHQLIVVMTRNNRGRNHNRYRLPFLRLVTGSLD